MVYAKYDNAIFCHPGATIDEIRPFLHPNIEEDERSVLLVADD